MFPGIWLKTFPAFAIRSMQCLHTIINQEERTCRDCFASLSITVFLLRCSTGLNHRTLLPFLHSIALPKKANGMQRKIVNQSEFSLLI